MKRALSLLVAICIAIQSSVAQEYSYTDQLRMARDQAYGGEASDVCNLESDMGPCKGFFPRYYFDAHQGKCTQFVYGGCYGNLNNFETLAECQSTCDGTSRKFGPKASARGLASESEDANIPSICNQPKERGPCAGYFPRYYYDSIGGTCKAFVYGGCLGNDNNFPTIEQCNQTCSGASQPESRKMIPSFVIKSSSSRIVICHLKPDRGPCPGYLPRFYYDPASKSCNQFNYGGCQGNANNFESTDECMKACAEVSRIPVNEWSARSLMSESELAEKPAICNLPVDKGPCLAFVPSYYFDTAEGICKEFIYGGCKGNDNNFHTIEQCNQTCGVSRTPSEEWSPRSLTLESDSEKPFICNLPKATGRCLAYIPRYYFDSAEGICKQFIYGGCEGNENNFETIEQCKQTCSVSGTPSKEWSPRSLTLESDSEKPPTCNVPKDKGPCKGYFPRYYFDSAEGICKQFIYGGCQGNENNFETIEQCKQTCRVSRTPSEEWSPRSLTLESDSEKPSICNLPKEEGPCKGYFPRYYFDSAEGICKQFVYGGCQGNENNFVTFEQCNQTCSVSRTPSEEWSPRSLTLESDLEKPPTCSVPKDKGPCKGYFPRYYFDSAEGICKQFIYGGCQGNENNFETIEQCKQTCRVSRTPSEEWSPRSLTLESDSEKPSICNLPKEEGPCNGYFPRYYFDSAEGICKQFVYGGCQANANNFVTFEQCNQTCSVSGTPSKEWSPRSLTLESDSEKPSICNLPKKEGPCKGYFPRYYFDSAEGICKQFVYGGCQGNENNFLTFEQCNQTCSVSRTPSEEWSPRSLTLEADSEKPPLCNLPKAIGPCKGYFPRYYFDSAEGICKQFIYGGCQGNENNFETIEQCKQTCSVSRTPSKEWSARGLTLESDTEKPSICNLPKKEGPCKGYFPRYYFDSAEGICKQFIYGGCQGNENNFETIEQCKQTCSGPTRLYEAREVSKTQKPRTPVAPKPRSVIDICQLPREVGPCKGNVPRYYYDSESRSCKRFVYGGCKGNANNFHTKKECIKTCRYTSGQHESQHRSPIINPVPDTRIYWGDH
ncbi:papilin-like isoform X6 [Ornithodoros turicata]|uniref:papilin-like isoform X6 n=1 Tax=Ornithodoros turicata TaxID=34597 RepID=UPI003139FE64